MRITIGKKLLLLCLMMLMLPAQAGIQVVGTRLIFNGEKKEASLPVDNNGTRPFLVQAWIDDGNDMGGPSKENKTPFFVTPPLSRLDGGKKNILRVLRVGEMNLPLDRESVFWMNVKEIPEAAKEKNVLQIAMRTRLKLFFRPVGLVEKFNPQEAYSKISWALVSPVTADSKGGKHFLVSAKNPTPYYITISNLKINDTDDVPVTAMLAPYGEATYSLEKTKYAKGGAQHLTYQTINDYGGETTEIKAMLTSSPKL